jgi:tetratricopeptide (TPR) repeat protein
MSLFDKFKDKLKQTVSDAQKQMEKTAADAKQQWEKSGIGDKMKEVAKRTTDAAQNVTGVGEFVALPRYRRARQMCEQGLNTENVDGAIADLEASIAADSYFRVDAHRLLAQAYDAKGRHEDALHTYRQAIDLLVQTPAVGPASQWIAEEYHQHIDAYTCEVYDELASLCERLERYDAAVWYARDCIAIDERHLPAYQILATALFKQNRVSEARDVLYRAMIHDRHGIVAEWEKELFGVME